MPSMAAPVLSSLVVIMLGVLMGSSSAHYLKLDYYQKTCPQVSSIVESVVDAAVARENRMGASLMRLHFHDCFVQGCDGSVLLNDTATFRGEQTALQNRGSIRGFNVVDEAKARLEAVCPGIVSCADILALAARDGTVFLKGPDWPVKLGRRDSTNASFTEAERDLPLSNETVTQLVRKFGVKGLSARDMVATSGGHTVGVARCVVFRQRIYNGTNIDPDFARSLQSICPQANGNGDTNLAPLDATPNRFDNVYFRDLPVRRGLLPSDQVLFEDASTRPIVESYVSDPRIFFKDFAAAMVRMSEISPLIGSARGQIRRQCWRPN